MLPSGSLNQAVFILGRVNIAFAVQARQVVMLEGDAFLLELGDLGRDLVDVEVQRGRFVGAREVGAIDVDQG